MGAENDYDHVYRSKLVEFIKESGREEEDLSDEELLQIAD